METAQTVYAKLHKASVYIFILLLGSGAAMGFGATLTHNVIMWSYGVVFAGMSGVFVFLALNAKNKLKQLGA